MKPKTTKPAKVTNQPKTSAHRGILATGDPVRLAVLWVNQLRGVLSTLADEVGDAMDADPNELFLDREALKAIRGLLVDALDYSGYTLNVSPPAEGLPERFLPVLSAAADKKSPEEKREERERIAKELREERGH
jgi:hypothetical protein